MTMAQMALAWVISRPGVSSAIVGATRPEQIAENVKAADMMLDEGLTARIDDVLAGHIVRDPALTQSPPARP